MLTKIVDGKTVECSPEEEAELRSAWSIPQPKIVDKREVAVNALLLKISSESDAPQEVKEWATSLGNK